MEYDANEDTAGYRCTLNGRKRTWTVPMDDVNHGTVSEQWTQRRVFEVGSWAKPHSGRITVEVLSSGKRVIVDGIGFSRRRD